jgi:outer membrane receptor protein involved in Fe transport
MDQFYTRFDYDLTDNVRAFIAGTWNSNEVVGNTGTQRTFVPGVNIGACNAFLYPAYQTQLGCTDANRGTAAEPTFKFEKQFDPLNNHGMGQNNEYKSENYFALAGLEGSFGEGYRWGVSYMHAESELKVAALNQNRQQIYAALDAVVDPGSGNVVCRITLTNPTVLPGCIPMNLFGPTAMTEEMAYYFVDTITNTTKNKLDGLAGNITGSPFNGWAGPVQMALSGELRKQEMSLDTDSRPTDFLDCTGLRFGNCNPTLPVHPNTWAPVSGVEQTITEVAYELSLPLIRDRTMFQDLNFQGAVRYAEYDNDPNDPAVVSRKFDATTWKLGLTWDITDTVTLRWARSHDFRAPSLYDLYQPVARGNTTNAIDYLLSPTGVPSQPRRNTGGNPNLDPELSYTNTVGIVWRPTPNFSVSLDAYEISLTDALYQLDGVAEPVQRACYASGGVSPLCQLQARANNSFTDTSPSNVMTDFFIGSVNIAEQESTGIDLEADFSTNLLDRPLRLRALVTYQPHVLYYIPFADRHDVAGVAYPQIGGFPSPVWKGSLFLNYRPSERWSIDLSERYRSSLDFTSHPTQISIGDVSSVAYTNLTVTYDLPTGFADFKTFVNVQNLFDKDPPPAGALNQQFPGNFPSNYAVGDDVVGRYITVGLQARF